MHINNHKVWRTILKFETNFQGKKYYTISLLMLFLAHIYE